jgi:hypothetical protein
MKIPRVHGILSILYPKLFKNRKTSTRPYKEKRSLGLGTQTIPSLRRTQDEDVQKPRPNTTKLQ